MFPNRNRGGTLVPRTFKPRSEPAMTSIIKSIAIITAVNGLGTKLSTNFDTISNSLK